MNRAVNRAVNREQAAGALYVSQPSESTLGLT